MNRTLNGALAMNAHKITGLADPASNQDAATKKYVDDHSGGGSDPSFDSITLGGQVLAEKNSKLRLRANASYTGLVLNLNGTDIGELHVEGTDIVFYNFVGTEVKFWDGANNLIDLVARCLKASECVRVNDIKVVGEQQADIPDTSGADLATQEAELNLVKALLRNHGLMAGASVVTPDAPTLVSNDGTGIRVKAPSTYPAGGSIEFKLYRNGSLLATVSTDEEYQDTAISAATLYHYTVKGSDGAGTLTGESSALDVTSVTVPPAPSNPTVTTNDGTGLVLNFPALSANGVDYELFNGSTSLAGGLVAGDNDMTYLLAGNTAYNFKLKENNIFGSSPASSGLSVTTSSGPAAPDAPNIADIGGGQFHCNAAPTGAPTNNMEWTDDGGATWNSIGEDEEASSSIGNEITLRAWSGTDVYGQRSYSESSVTLA